MILSKPYIIVKQWGCKESVWKGKEIHGEWIVNEDARNISAMTDVVNMYAKSIHIHNLVMNVVSYSHNLFHPPHRRHQ